MNVRAFTRVRHALRLRRLQVTDVARPTSNVVRVTLAGSDLHDFPSVGFDDHVKLFIPAEGTTFDGVPELGPHGPIFDPRVTAPALRDYTPHHVDFLGLTLQIDFALHGEGPATAWARRARTGDRLIVGGPRGSFLVRPGFDWELLAGDDTALPAIRRRLAELPEGARAVVFAEVDSPEDQDDLGGSSAVETHWVHRMSPDGASASPLLAALSAARFPTGSRHAWIACESSDAKAIRAALLGRGFDPTALRASGYWRRGAAATHDVHD